MCAIYFLFLIWNNYEEKSKKWIKYLASTNKIRLNARIKSKNTKTYKNESKIKNNDLKDKSNKFMHTNTKKN